LQICCRYVADMLQICCRYVADMLQICCRYVADMLQICCRYVYVTPQEAMAPRVVAFSDCHVLLHL